LLAARTNLNPTRALHFDYLKVAERLLGPDVLGPAVAEAVHNIDDVERMERAQFFGDRAQAVEAKFPYFTAENRPAVAGDRKGLRKKVDLLRRSATNDPSRRPDLAEALVQLAWATFDARTSSKSSGLSFLRDAERIYRDLASEHPKAYLPAHVDSLIQYSAMARPTSFFSDFSNPRRNRGEWSQAPKRHYVRKSASRKPPDGGLSFDFQTPHLWGYQFIPKMLANLTSKSRFDYLTLEDWCRSSPLSREPQ